MRSVRCVVVGDSAVGKTYLLFTYIKKIFPKEYIPGFRDTYSTQIDVDGQTVSLNLSDTAGREEYDHLRPLCYTNQVNVIIICFSIASPSSFENEVLEKLREQNQTTVDQQQGTTMVRQIKAVKYLECASVNQDGLDEVFDEAVRASISHSTTTKNHVHCCK
ncbi:ras-related protein ced-10-like [Scomber scombrus]|uniref:Ras-related protein ced-10-like n=1 Tax=Scomber scombrus TaxID=13677 RepID=A0AAV1PH23_SCOSC